MARELNPLMLRFSMLRMLQSGTTVKHCGVDDRMAHPCSLKSTTRYMYSPGTSRERNTDMSVSLGSGPNTTVLSNDGLAPGAI
jgi:hypothetical protein